MKDVEGWPAKYYISHKYTLLNLSGLGVNLSIDKKKHKKKQWNWVAWMYFESLVYDNNPIKYVYVYIIMKK